MHQQVSQQQRLRKQTRGQSLVEMALLLPLMLLILFGIMEFGYYIYSIASVHQAARNGAEEAAKSPPFPRRVAPQITGPHARLDEADPNFDPCMNAIFDAVASDATLFPDIADFVTVRYPDYVVDPRGSQTPGEPDYYLPPEERRQRGYPIEITISYPLEPLTPLWQMVPGMGDQPIRITTTTRRSIEDFGRDPTAENFAPCNE